jgi:hypothetical protein
VAAHQGGDVIRDHRNGVLAADLGGFERTATDGARTGVRA